MSTNTLRGRGLRRATAFAGLTLVLGAAAFIMTPAAASETEKPYLIENALPEGALLHLRLDGATVERNWSQLAIAQLCDDEQMKAFMAPMFQAAEGMISEPMREIEDQTGLKLDEMKGMLKGTFTATVANFDMGDGSGPPDADVVLTFDLEKDKELVTKLGGLLGQAAEKGLGEKPREVELAGQRAWQVQVEGIDMFWVASEGHLVAGTKAKTVGDVVTRLKAKTPVGGLFASAEFDKGFQRTVPSAQAAAFTFVDVKRVLDLVRKSPLAEQAPVDAIADGLGISSMASVSYGLSLEGPAVVDRFFVSMPEGGKGLYGNMKHAAKPLRSTTMAPANCLAYAGFRYDLAATVDGLIATAEQIDEDVAAEIDNALGEFEKNVGFSLIDDFLASLDHEIGYWVGASPYGGMVPEIVIALEIKNREKIDFCWKRMGEKMGQQVPMRSMKFKGKELRWFDLGPVMGAPDEFGPGLKPTLMMDGDFLLVAFAPQTLKNYVVSRAGQRADINQNADLQKGLAHLRRTSPEAGHDGLAFVDLGGVFTFMIDSAVPVLQNVNMPPEVPVDMALFPTSDVFRRHLFGLTATNTVKPDGLEGQIHSPMGYLPLYSTLIAGMAGAFVARESAAAAEADEFGWEEIEPVEDEPMKDDSGKNDDDK
ncbi:MAG: hypothetical protein R3F20_04415 [Planctomycetota bacterium]